MLPHFFTPFADTWLVLVTATTLVTLLAYYVGLFCYRRSGFFPLLHPVIVSILLIASLITLTHLPYEYYERGGDVLRWLLGPATVALALPLYQQLAKIRALMLPIAIGIVGGSLIAIASAILPAYWLGADDIILRSLASKSITTPIAIGVAKEIEAVIPLATGVVILTGILGICIAPWIFKRLNITDERAKGFALGLTAHGIGTARALEESLQCGAFSTLALCLTGLFSSAIIPALIVWFYA